MNPEKKSGRDDLAAIRTQKRLTKALAQIAASVSDNPPPIDETLKRSQANNAALDPGGHVDHIHVLPSPEAEAPEQED